ncbi:MAG: translocation/assembly module TamB domain-containing protein [Gallionellaceae bacterium]|nr:translocation/assembly module TamB domain-containing protein [Gallionellaceae bacterium]
MAIRSALRYGLWGLAALPLLAVALAWLAGSEPALRLIASQAERLSGGRLEIRGVHGSAYGPLHIDALTLTTETKRFELGDARLDWSPRALWQGRLSITRLDLASVRVSTVRPDPEPPQLPDSLRLPVGLSLPAASLGRLVIRTSAGEQVMSDIRLGLEQAGHTYRLDLRNLSTPWGRVEAQASLADAPPYALAGQARFSHPSGSATANLGGRLDRIDLKAAAALAGGEARADLLLTPFARRPLAEAQISARGIDPAAWDPGLPRAEIGLAASLHSQGAQDYAGEFSAANGLAGTWDKQRLPLRGLSARFSGNADGLDLTDLNLDLARAGHFTGSGRADPERLALDLKTRDFDPRGLYGKLRSLRLAGAIRLQADGERQGLQADLGYQRYRLTLDAEQRDRVLHIKQARLVSGAGQLSLFGTLGLDEARSFDLAGGLDGFDPAAFGDYPKARINASFHGAGRLTPAPETSLSFAIADSRFRNQPLAGQGNLRLAEKRLWDSDAELRLAGNRLRLQGAFGAPGDRLAFQLLANQLGVVDPALSGRIEATGQLSGSLATPAGEADIQAEGLAWGKDYRLGSLHAKARLDQGLDGILALDARLAKLNTPALTLDRASLIGQGRRDRHSLVITAGNPDLDLGAEVAGAWREAGWSGQILRLTNQGRHPLALQAPARLEIAADGGRLSEARLAALGAVFNVRDARYQAGRISSQGEFKGLSITVLKRFPAWPEGVGGDLVLGGNWQIDAGEQVNGRINLARERGDLVLAAGPDTATALGLQQLSLLAEASDSRLHASLAADGSALGRLSVQADSRLARRDGVWGIAADTPFQASADLALQSLAWAAPLLDKTGASRFDGSLAAQVKGSSSLAAPQFSGTISGERFRLALPEQGLDLRDGRFQAELSQDTLVLKSLSLRGGDGSLTGQGRLGLREGQPDLQLALKADKLQVVSRPDRLLLLSGDGTVALLARKLQLRARLKADRGLVELAREDAPSPSEDVVVLGREDRAAAKGIPYAVDMDLDLDLGERFFLKGRGIDAQLGGAVKLTGRQGLPLRGNGGIRVVKGTYAAYGQRLDIERGQLNFQGPLDNPGLNIVAMRKNQEVAAGVAITGSAQAPVVKLVSNPTLPDSEKLSWLVLGHGMADTGSREFDALQLAAGALLGAGESVTLQQRIAHAAGLEEVSLKGAGTLESSVLTLGKRLSSRAYLSYEQGLLGTSALVKINYTLSRRLSLRTQAGTNPAVDLFYTFSFD